MYFCFDLHAGPIPPNSAPRVEMDDRTDAPCSDNREAAISNSSQRLSTATHEPPPAATDVTQAFMRAASGTITAYIEAVHC